MFVMDDSPLAGRVTFEIDGGVVTAASIDTEPPPPPPGIDQEPADIDRANILVAGLKQLIYIDNGFGDQDVFDDIKVASVLGVDPARTLGQSSWN